MTRSTEQRRPLQRRCSRPCFGPPSPRRHRSRGCRSKDTRPWCRPLDRATQVYVSSFFDVGFRPALQRPRGRLAWATLLPARPRWVQRVARIYLALVHWQLMFLRDADVVVGQRVGHPRRVDHVHGHHSTVDRAEAVERREVAVVVLVCHAHASTAQNKSRSKGGNKETLAYVFPVAYTGVGEVCHMKHQF